MRSTVLFSLILFLLFSCQTNQNEGIIEEFTIASRTQKCQGYFTDQSCLMIKSQQNSENWEFFYETIKGFHYEQGYEYKIKVLRQYIPENLNIADSSLYEYTLLEIISKTFKDSQGF